MGWKDDARGYVKSKQSGSTYKFSDGDNVIRILPNVKGTEYPPLFFYKAHPQVGPNKRFVRCGKDNEGNGKCWLCDVQIPALRSKGREKSADAIQAIEQVVFQVASVEDGKMRGPQALFLKIGRTARAIGNRIVNKITGPKAFDDPKKGRNLVVTKSGAGIDTTYDDLQVEDESTAVPSAILAKLKDLEEIAGKPYSKDLQIATYKGEELEEEEDDDVEVASEEDEDETETESETESEDESQSEDETESEDESESDESESESESDAEETVDDDEAAAEGEGTDEDEADEPPVEEDTPDDEPEQEDEGADEEPKSKPKPVSKPAPKKPVKPVKKTGKTDKKK